MMAVIKIINVDRIDAFFIRNLRKNNGDSGEKICKELGINLTYLYYVESGEKRLSKDFLNKILSYYNVNYNKDINVYNEAYDLTIKLYESFVFKNNDLLTKYEKEFNEKEELFANSRGFIFNDLMIAIINLLRDKTLTKLKLDESKKYLSLYDSNVACIYGVIYGFGKGIYKNLNDSGKMLYDIFEKFPVQSLLPCIKGMFYYQLGRISYEEKRNIKALKFYNEAICALQQIYCVERVNQANIEIANTLQYMRQYNDAEDLYYKMLEEARRYNYNKRICMCLNNLAYLYLIQKQYDKCLESVYKAKKAGSVQHDLNYYLAYCTYKTKSKEEARSLVAKLLQDEDNRYTARMMKLIQGFINDNTDKIDRYFSLIKNDIIQLNDALEMKLLYEMVISYYMDKNDSKCMELCKDYFVLEKL